MAVQTMGTRRPNEPADTDHDALVNRVEMFFELILDLKSGAQVSSEEYQTLQRVHIIAAGFGLTDLPFTIHTRR